MAQKEYIGITRLTYIFGLLKNLFDAKADASDLADKVLPAYGTCATAASERIKVVTISDNSWSLKTGCIISVKFTNTNTYSASVGNPVQLNVNSSGVKNIYYGSSNNPTGDNPSVFGKADVVNFYQYDGTNWVWLSCGESSNVSYDSMSQAEATAGSSTTARTISAKVLGDTINGKMTSMLTGTIAAGSTSLTIQDSSITTSSFIDIYFQDKVLSPSDVTVTTGQIVIEIDEETTATNVAVRVLNA